MPELEAPRAPLVLVRDTHTVLVLDTNIVLDLFVFDDPGLAPLKAALATAALHKAELDWISTPAMRAELLRVLAYPHIAARMQRGAIDAANVLAAFDAQARMVQAASKAPFSCKDLDDQIFIDLAVAHGATLLSKDQAVLCMAKRLETRSARALTAIVFVVQSWPLGPAASTA